MSISEEVYTLQEPWIGILNNAADADGLICYEDFSRLALFHPAHGYYASQRNRVGKSESSDFYTASSHREVFPKLLAEAVSFLLKEKSFDCETFYEVGSETGNNLWSEQSLPCPSSKILRLGDELAIEGNAVLFSNELFDAQPFQRWIAQNGKWRPIRIKLEGNELKEVISESALSPSDSELFDQLPEAPAFEYHIDVSIAAQHLLRKLLSSPWKGLFIAFDYGKTWDQLIYETPQGTARGYSKHLQTTELHFNPGEQDLTTHVCWNLLIRELEQAGFTDIQLEHQSRFFMRCAQPVIQSIVSRPEGLTDRRKGQLLELISPGFFGQRFQVLTAFRQ